MKQSYLPLVLVVLLVGAVVLYFRPIEPRDLTWLTNKLGLPSAWAAEPQTPSDAGRDDPNRFGPERPIAPGRPAAWPSDSLPGEQRPQPPGVGPSPAAMIQGIPCEGAEILARVGNDVILAREAAMGLAEIWAKNKDTVPESVLQQKIGEIIKKRIDDRVEEKLVCQHAQRTIPKDRYAKIMESFGGEYDRKILPELMKQANISSRREFEQKLRDSGITLEIHKRAYIEGILAHEWLKSEVKADEEISYDQIEAYYREHPAEFVVHPPLARWEQLTARTSHYRTEEAAYAAMVEMGNQVLDGTPLTEVAKARSQGTTASDGGLRDWTGQHSLASDVLDQAIFSLPIGQLSHILKDDQGFHIVRVIERKPVAMKPLADAQVEIRKKIKAQRLSDAKAKYVAKIRQETPVWTAFDNDQGSLSARLGGLYR